MKTVTDKMFSSSSSRQTASENAAKQAAVYESSLSMRIHLQKVVDVGNSLPGKSMVSAAKGQSGEVIGAYHKLNTSLDSTLKQLTSLLEKQIPSSSSITASSSSKSPMTWETVVAPQMLLRPHWEATLDKWNARLHFGSERKQSKLKVFNQKLWGQIQIALSDKQRVVEKSRMPLPESSRMDRASGDGAAAANLDEGEDNSNKDGDSDSDGSQDDNDDDNNNKRKKKRTDSGNKKRQVHYDLEVYDDRSFYNLLLKSFIQSAASGGDGQAASMRPDDLAALRKYRRTKAKVDRKASKGRKIRYVVHAKLQNFTFPITQPEPAMDVNRLYQSLLQ